MKKQGGIKMGFRVLIVTSFLLVVNSAMWAQPRVEITPFAAYTFSEGINFNAADIGSGVTISRLTPKSGVSYGFQADWLASERFAIGFLFNNQHSKLEASILGGGKTELTDMKVRNYHAVFTIDLAEEDARVRPFFFGGLGATQYSPDDIMGNSIQSTTRFSTTWGGGVKTYVSEDIGFRFTGRWTPTYYNSDPAGIWCSPFWAFGCWVVSESNYSHQFELSAGVTFRF